MAITIDIKEDALYQLGQEEGLQQGKEEGMQRAREETAVNMLKRNMSTEVITELTGVPAERIAQLKQELDARKG